MTHQTLFLDRDGVVNVDHGYIYQPKTFEFIPGVFEACRAFHQAGFQIVIITNQSGIGRGYYTEDDFHHLTKWMKQEFKQHKVPILDVYFCPHHPQKALAPYLKDCDCRKPRPGMLLQAMAEHGLDPNTSIMVGDKPSDMLAAVNARIRHKYLVTSGQALTEDDKALADGVYSSLPELAEAFLN